MKEQERCRRCLNGHFLTGILKPFIILIVNPLNISTNVESCLQCSNIIDMRTACTTNALQALLQAALCDLK